ncbi:zinc-binding alcohol dehydrogenase family protein [Cytobacillus oceanisediminis]|jgi:zinc-binding alcohol dehydrogenase family protein|uniref:Zinc-type alcohol dehydrogenase-like protein n=1 Tax=Cytobacillus oceanisediminis TaxID=665099 RepID=A0A2V2ZYL9_9BACI|nr:zinc-binding alcohol dehydrogenase family protein [Cytobacillus oceanisediminis]PWW29511.1 zinc-binding alcohol dehydrogenase family protein [Cytobacillus oceanisediminis]
MATMKAVGLHRYLPIDNPESLLDLQIEKPSASGRDLLVRVKAVAVNPVDYKVRSPKEKVEENPKILGWDVAGIVEEVGPDCKLFKPGDEVYYAGDITRQGGNSEFHLVDERIVGEKPKSLSFAQAAALPLTTITAYEALFDRMNIRRKPSENQNKTLLIIGAAGGVGSIAIQLAKWAGLTVIGTASRPESIDWSKKQGADHTINHFKEFVPQLKQLGFETVHYILCLNTTDKHWINMTNAIAPQGKICSIVETKGPLDLTLLKNKSATFVWELMFTRSMFQTEDMIEQHKLLNEVADLVDSKIIKTTLTEQFSPINAENLRKAHTILETGKSIGKTVVENF